MGALSPSPSLFLPNLLRPNLLRPKYSLIAAGPETSASLQIFHSGQSAAAQLYQQGYYTGEIIGWIVGVFP